MSFGPRTSDFAMVIQPEMLETDGTVTALGSVELRVVQVGHSEVTLANDAQKVSYRVRLIFSRTTRKVMFSLDAGNLAGVNGATALRTLRFFQAVSRGGTLRFVDVETELPMWGGPPPPGQMIPDAEFLELLEQMAFDSEAHARAAGST